MAQKERTRPAVEKAPEREPVRPVHEIRLGRVKAAIWANETEHGIRHSVTLCRVYKDQGDKWKTTDSFGRDDLLVLAKVSDLAHTWICENGKGQEAPF